jgi:general stress protein YciG
MAGNREGGLKAAQKNKASNPNFYRDLGRIGGAARVPKGFALNRELARRAGSKGGSISRRPKPAQKTEADSAEV